MNSIELFAGIGGISLAAEWAGVETVAFCERDSHCQKVLNKHWPTIPIFDDVKTLNKQLLEERGIDVGTIDIISGGFPCQPYSIAGKRKGTEDDRDLWPEMFRIIEEIRPTWVVGENVANFVGMELDRTLLDLETIGYNGKTFVIPACSVNAKHRRERTFIVAHSNHRHQFKNKKIQTRRDASGNGGPTVRNTDSESKPQTYKKISSIGKTGKSREGSSRESWREAPRTYWETNKPPICGVVNGISGGLDKSRLIALGNAVVPQQIYPVLKAIVEVEHLKEG